MPDVTDELESRLFCHVNDVCHWKFEYACFTWRSRPLYVEPANQPLPRICPTAGFSFVAEAVLQVRTFPLASFVAAVKHGNSSVVFVFTSGAGTFASEV